MEIMSNIIRENGYIIVVGIAWIALAILAVLPEAEKEDDQSNSD